MPPDVPYAVPDSEHEHQHEHEHDAVLYYVEVLEGVQGFLYLERNPRVGETLNGYLDVTVRVVGP